MIDFDEKIASIHKNMLSGHAALGAIGVVEIWSSLLEQKGVSIKHAQSSSLINTTRKLLIDEQAKTVLIKFCKTVQEPSGNPKDDKWGAWMMLMTAFDQTDLIVSWLTKQFHANAPSDFCIYLGLEAMVALRKHNQWKELGWIWSQPSNYVNNQFDRLDEVAKALSLRNGKTPEDNRRDNRNIEKRITSECADLYVACMVAKRYDEARKIARVFLTSMGAENARKRLLEAIETAGVQQDDNFLWPHQNDQE